MLAGPYCIVHSSAAARCCIMQCYVHTRNNRYIELLMDISLSERARLVRPWPLRAPTSKPPPFSTCRTFPVGLCFLHFSLRSRSFLPFFFFRFECMRVLRVRHRGRARHRRGSQRVVAGRGGLQGTRSPFSLLGVACASRHKGSMNGLCLASWCGSGFTMYERISLRVVVICKIKFKRCLRLRRN